MRARRRPGPRRVPRRDRGGPAAARARRRGSRRRRTSSTSSRVPALLGAGVDDWGGVSPLTPDHVNPERPWPPSTGSRPVTAEAGFELAERLTVHPEYVRRRRAVARPAGLPHVAALADRRTGWPVAGVRPAGCRGRSPTAAWRSVGRTDLHRGGRHRRAHRRPARRTSTPSTATGTRSRARPEVVRRPLAAAGGPIAADATDYRAARPPSATRATCRTSRRSP